MAGVGVGTRTHIYESVITFPATKTAGAVTLRSDEMYPFEGSGWGKVKVITGVTVGDTIGDTIAIKAYVSYGQGDTGGAGDSWFLAATYTDVGDTSGAKNTPQAYIWLAPRLRIDAVFDAAATLGASHGAYVDVEFEEVDPESLRVWEMNIQSVAATKAAGDSGLVWTDYGDSVDIGTGRAPGTVYIGMTVADRSKVANTFIATLESSHDGAHYETFATLTNAKPSNGTGTQYGVDSFSGDTISASRYWRTKLASGDTDAALSAEHGIRYNLLIITE